MNKTFVENAKPTYYYNIITLFGSLDMFRKDEHLFMSLFKNLSQYHICLATVATL